jgi:hypothetical protein
MQPPKSLLTLTSLAVMIGVLGIPGPVLAGSTSIAVGDPASNGFVENRGQIDPQVLYYAAGPQGGVYLTRDAIVLDLAEARLNAKDDLQTLRRQGRAVWLCFDGGAPVAMPDPVGQLRARFNYFYGCDPTQWEIGVPAYRQIVYRDLWPGVDLACSIDAGRVVCSILTAPGADPARARFRYDGATPAELEKIGAFSIAHHAQAPAPEPARDDPSRLLWSTFLGGTSEELGWSVALDADRNPVVAGLTTSSHFPTTPGAYDTTYAGLGDVFVAKLDASGSDLLWSTFLGGTAALLDYGYAVVLDSQANPIVTGYTWSADFPVTPGAYDTGFNGAVDAFVSKLGADGGSLLWSSFLGGIDYDIGYAVTLDSQKNPVIAGRTLSYDFPVTPGTYDPYAGGEEDAFVSKLSASGQSLLWSTFIGGYAFDEASSVLLDADDNPIIVGYTASTDYPGGTYAGGLYDVTATKLDPTASTLLWSRTLGGSSYEFGNGLALDASGDLLICGATDSPDFPVTAGVFDDSYNGGDDAFAAKIGGADGSLLWATFLGGTTPGYETAFGIGADDSGHVVLAGSTPSSDFPVTPDAYDGSYNGGLDDAFVTRLDPTGSILEWSTLLGGPGEDYAWSLALDPDGAAVVVGTAGPDGFPVTPGAYDTSYNGDISDVFAARLLPSVDPAAVPEPGQGRASLSAVRIAPAVVVGGTRIEFTLTDRSSVRLDLLDAAGRLRATLARAAYPAGSHSVYWDASAAGGARIPSGRYFLRMTTSSGSRSVPMTLLR